MSEITVILNAIEGGDAKAAERLLPLVYDELRRLARQRLSQEAPGQTLQATALVHEAYLRLVDVEQPQPWGGRGHFFAAAAEAMRRILIENARRKRRGKHGGQLKRVELKSEFAISAPDADDLLTLDEALCRFEREDPEKAQLVKLRYFGGLTLDQAADALGISLATAKRHWAYARAWLYSAIQGGAQGS